MPKADKQHMETQTGQNVVNQRNKDSWRFFLCMPNFVIGVSIDNLFNI